MKNLFASTALVLALGCSADAVPTVELDSDGKPTKVSLTAVRESLSAADAAAFDEAMQRIVLSAAFPGVDRAEGGLEGLAVLAALGAQGEEAVEDRARAAVAPLEGMTGKEVIEAAAALEVPVAERQALEDEEDEALRSGRDAYEGMLDVTFIFVVSDFRTTSTEWSKDRVVDISFTNNSTFPVAMLTFEGEVRTPGRAVAWADDDGLQVSFPGGVEPGETVTRTYRFNRFTTLGSREFPEDAVFSASIECVYGPKDEEDRYNPMFDPPKGVCNRIVSW